MATVAWAGEDISNLQNLEEPPPPAHRGDQDPQQPGQEVRSLAHRLRFLPQTPTGGSALAKWVVG